MSLFKMDLLVGVNLNTNRFGLGLSAESIKLLMVFLKLIFLELYRTKNGKCKCNGFI